MWLLSQFGVVGVVVGILLLFTPLFVLIWLWVRWINKRRDAQIQQFCDRYGLQYEHGRRFPVIQGTIQGRSFEITTEFATSASGRARPNQPPLFTMRLGLNGGVPAGLFVAKRGLLDPTSPRRTGDDAFDRKMYVDCPDEQVPAMQAYLNSERRQALADLAAIKGLGCLGRGRLVWQSQGYRAKAEWLDARYQALAALAPRLDG